MFTKQLLSLILAVSVVGNVVSWRTVAEMTLRFNELTTPKALQVGELVPIVDDRGVSASQSSSGPAPTVAYFYSTSCVWCERNAPSVVSLVKQIGTRYRIVGINVDRPLGPSDAQRPVATNPAPITQGMTLPFPTIRAIAEKDLRAYKLRSTPTTIVIGPGGKVLGVWEGAYGNQAKGDIEKFFGVSLPPLADSVTQVSEPVKQG